VLGCCKGRHTVCFAARQQRAGLKNGCVPAWRERTFAFAVRWLEERKHRDLLGSGARGLIVAVAAGAVNLACTASAPPTRVAAPIVWSPVAQPETDPANGVSPDAAPSSRTAGVRASSAEAPHDDETLAILATTARCPKEMALVADRVCVDRWEASLVERAPGGLERQWSPFSAVDGQEHRVRAVSRPGVVPQGYISGKQAMFACMASGKRLCTADEWERACRGPDGTQFPYGPIRRAGACNDDVRAVHPVIEVATFLGLPADRWWREGMNEPLINQLPGSLLRTAERSECTNDYGVFDMVGNLHEWIDDPDGTFRGGYYMDTTLNGDGCQYATTGHEFRYHDYSTGFRCCLDADRVE
jgi:formylglycine-generating enzyme